MGYMDEYVSYKEMTSMYNVSGKVAIVTGAASGLGLGIAYAFAANGGKVVAVDINKEGIDSTVSEITKNGGIAKAEVCDVTSSESVKKLYDKTVKEFGKIDALYVIPGINYRKKIENYTYEEFDKVINLNLKGTFTLLKEIGTKMGRDGSGGSVVLMSSIRSVVTEPGQGVYASTKAAMVQLARTLAAEMGKYNVRVNAIGPGVIDTPLTKQIKNDKDWYNAYATKSPLKRWGRIKEIAGPAVFLATDAASFINATIIFVDGGWTGVDGRYEPNV